SQLPPVLSPATPIPEPLVIKPVINLYQVNFTCPDRGDRTVHDPPSQPEEGDIIPLRGDKLNHRVDPWLGQRGRTRSRPLNGRIVSRPIFRIIPDASISMPGFQRFCNR